MESEKSTESNRPDVISIFRLVKCFFAKHDETLTCILHSKLYGNCSLFLLTLAAYFLTGLKSKFSIQEKQICYLKTFRDKVEDFVAMATCRTQHKLSRDSHHKRLSVRTMAWTFGSNCFTLCSQEALRWNPSVSSLSFSLESGSDLRFVFSSGTNKTLSFTLFQQIKGKTAVRFWCELQLLQGHIWS